MKCAASPVQRLGSGDQTCVNASALTRAIYSWRDFNREGCLVHGPHPGRARAVFYSGTVTHLALGAGIGLQEHRLDMSKVNSMLKRGAVIMAEVGAIVVSNGLTERELVIAVADAHQKLVSSVNRDTSVTESSKEGGRGGGQT